MDKRLIKNSIIYTVASVLQKGILFLLLPVYTAFLSTSEYGILNVITSIISLLSALFLLSLQAAAARLNFLDKYANIRSQVWGTILVMILLNSLIMGSVFFLFRKELMCPLARGIEFYPFLFIALLTTIVNPLYLYFQTYLQTIQDAKRYAINMLTNFGINVSLILILLIIFNKGVLGILYANLITAILFFLYSIKAFLSKIKVCVSKNIVKEALKYSLPLLPHTTSSWVMAMVDKVLLNNILSASAAGVYSAGYQLGGAMNIVTSAVSQAYTPWFFQQVKKGEKGLEEIFLFAKYASMTFALIAMLFSFVSKEVCCLILSDEYEEAYLVILFVAFGYVYFGLYVLYVATLFLKKTYYVTGITFIAALSGIFFNLMLIPVLGMIGSGVSILISYFLTALLAWLLSYYNKIKFPFFKTIGSVSLIFLITLGTVFITDDLYGWLYKSVVLLIMICIVSRYFNDFVMLFFKICRKDK